MDNRDILFTTVAVVLFSTLLFGRFLLADSTSEIKNTPASSSEETIVLGGGCFWCMEATYRSFKGVEKVESGYAGGLVDHPDYLTVASGNTGHAEVVKITFNPNVISLSQILTIFFHAHDPTTKNRQGADVGEEYRSIILYNSDKQKLSAQEIKSEIAKSKLWDDKPIVTEIESLKEFYKAEDYHQDYYNKNPTKGYCLLVIGPKLQKIKKEFQALLK